MTPELPAFPGYTINATTDTTWAHRTIPTGCANHPRTELLALSLSGLDEDEQVYASLN